MDNLRGIVLIVVAMAAFTIEDTFIKRLSADMPVGQILIVIGFGCACVFAALARLRGHRIFTPAAWRPVFVVRALCEAFAAICFATALSLVDISVVASVFQTTPLAITMGAALFLGEDVGWRRWTAIAIGFSGVLLIIRPGLAGFEPMALLVLVSVVMVATRDIITRRIDVAVPSSVISFQGFAILVPAGTLLLLLFPGAPVAPAPLGWAMLGFAVMFGAGAYYCIVTAMRIADASVVTPFRYTRLLFSILVGVVVFGERPDTLTLTGAALIIATGLYTFLRERRLARAAARPPSYGR